MRRLLIALVTVLAAAPVTAQSTQEFRSTAGGYTLQLPAAWRRLPAAELNRLRQSVPQQGIGNAYEAAYRVTSSRAHMAVATMDLGQRYSRAQFREAMTGAQVQAQMQAAADGVITQGRTARMDVPVWDEENGAAWTRVAHRSDGRTPPFSWTVGILHPDSRTMVVLAYTGAPGEDEARVRADLLAIVRSLRVD